MLDLRDARPCYPYAVPALGELLPGKALPLPTAPIAPFEHTAHGAFEEAVQRAVVAVQTIVGVMASQPDVQLPVEHASRQVPVLFDPCRHPSARRMELLARGASLDARHALAVWHPSKLESQKREAPPHAWMETTETQEAGFVGSNLEVELLQPEG